MFRVFFLCVALMFSVSARAQQWSTEKWSTEDKILSGVLMSAWVIDYGQTNYLLKVQDRAKRTHMKGDLWFNEDNPLLGKQPRRSTVNAYFLLMPAVGFLVLDNIPQAYRTNTLRVLSALEVGNVGRNFHVGIHVSY